MALMVPAYDMVFLSQKRSTAALRMGSFWLLVCVGKHGARNQSLTPRFSQPRYSVLPHSRYRAKVPVVNMAQNGVSSELGDQINRVSWWTGLQQPHTALLKLAQRHAVERRTRHAARRRALAARGDLEDKVERLHLELSGEGVLVLLARAYDDLGQRVAELGAGRDLLDPVSQ